jgi:hypothetical protein
MHMIPVVASAVSGRIPWRLIGVGALLLVVGGAVGYHFWTVHTMETQVAKAERGKADAEKVTAQFRAEVAVAEGNVTKLRGALRTSNDAVVALVERGHAMETAANLRAANRLRLGERERLAIRLDDRIGPDAMNLWFETMFGTEK